MGKAHEALQEKKNNSKWNERKENRSILWGQKQRKKNL